MSIDWDSFIVDQAGGGDIYGAVTLRVGWVRVNVALMPGCCGTSMWYYLNGDSYNIPIKEVRDSLKKMSDILTAGKAWRDSPSKWDQPNFSNLRRMLQRSKIVCMDAVGGEGRVSFYRMAKQRPDDWLIHEEHTVNNPNSGNHVCLIEHLNNYAEDE